MRFSLKVHTKTLMKATVFDDHVFVTIFESFRNTTKEKER